MKQSKLRRRRVIRYTVAYFFMFFLFIGLIVAPLVAGKYVPGSVKNILSDLAGFHLIQPYGQNNNNTNGTQQTGTGMPGYSGAGLKSMTSTALVTATGTGSVRLF